MNRHRSEASTAVSAGAIGTFLSLLNVVVGFGFQAVIAASLGVGALADVFQVGWTIITFAAVVQFTMVTSLLVPQLQSVTNGINSVGRSWLPIALGVGASGLQALTALNLATDELRFLLLASAPAHLFVGMTAVPQARAFIGRRFWVAGFGPVANGLALLLSALANSSQLNGTILGTAIALGYVAQWAVTAFGVRDLSALANRGISIPIGLFLGVLGFTLVSKFQPVLERMVSYQLAAGSTAALGYGQKIAQGLILFATFGIATASTASLARHASANNLDEAADLLARITTATVVFASMVCAVALPAAYPVVVVLFERGAFTAEDSHFVANVVIAQLPWVWSGALAGVLTAYLYVDRRYAQVLFASLGGLLATTLLAFALRDFSPKYAVAIASSAGGIVSQMTAILILSRTSIWADYRRHFARRWRLLFAAFAVMAVSIALTATLELFAGSEATIPQYWLATVVTVILAIGIVLIPAAPRLEMREAVNAKL